MRLYTENRHITKCILCVILFFYYCDGLKDKNITIGGIFPMSGSWAGGQGCLPAVEMALEDVNSRDDILSEYHLNMDFDDSQCMPGLGTKVLYELLYNQPKKVIVLTGCSIVSTFVAQAAKMWHLIVLAYGSSSPALSNRDRFPTFFRTHPSATLHNPTRVKIFQLFEWKRIATIQETQEVFTSTVEDLEERVKAAGIEVAVRQNFLTDPTNAVRNLKRQDARIIVGVFYEDMARRVFCQAYKEKLYGKKYVWFIIGWYPNNWYKVDDPSINCTSEQLKEALEGHITTEAVILHQEKTKTDTNMTAQQFKERLDERLNVSDTSQVGGYPEAPLAYDAVWALAIALNTTSERLRDRGLNIEDFNYSNSEITDEIYSAMNSTKFVGVSGNVAFSSQGDRIAWTKIEQLINGTYYTLGYYDQNSDNLTWLHKERWTGGHPPPDRTKQMPVLRVVSLGLFLSMCGLSTFGIIAGVACLIFNIINSNRRCILHSHPNMNSIVVLGCILCLLCVFLLGLDSRFVAEETYPLICQLRAWILSLGFSLAYGGMFSKIWTVHRLTTSSRQKNKKEVKNCEMYVVLTAIILIDLIILSTWQAIDPMYRSLEMFDLEPAPSTDQDIMYKPYLEHCDSNNISIWLGVVFGHKGILLLFGIFLSYETRSVKLKQVNDSRFVGMSIYNVVVLCVITVPIVLIIKSQQDASFAFVALAIILCSFLSLGLIFGPKVIEILRNPKRNQHEIRSLTESVVGKEEEERHQKLLTENQQLQAQIAEMEEKVRTLNKQLKEKMQERIRLTTNKCNNSNLSVDHTCVQNNKKPSTYSPSKTDVIKTPECMISPDYFSDSGVHTYSTVIRSARNSPSENEV
ncbi:gamma-aminobutyric acid type B receptor subunit 1-like [Ruditapes philippinarum]|uniref:gamma-aminobutyric acid type B receptor subunit 1-like n=1 Tax=Ruditapes philippinarum TaxID=129788 RepID=UPI00295C115B|nr:gamma-aminobutyric acid type B receptor subunit 1-like [Ruditapes philippinarum]